MRECAGNMEDSAQGDMRECAGDGDRAQDDVGECAGDIGGSDRNDTERVQGDAEGALKMAWGSGAVRRLPLSS